MSAGPIERMVPIRRTIANVWKSGDLQEGIRAYKKAAIRACEENRKPRFPGK